jgi:uncharacterized protein YndB with AHSA1/START domain
MSERSITHNTFVIERTYPAPVERVFAAFVKPESKRRWFAESEHATVVSFEMDFRVGGSERSTYKFGEGTPFPGTLFGNETTYLDIEPNRRIVLAYTMNMAGKRFSASLATVELLASGDGTKLIFTEQGAYFEGADGPQIREQGWQALLDRLAKELTSHA